jgi:hypothetical protein
MNLNLFIPLLALIGYIWWSQYRGTTTKLTEPTSVVTPPATDVTPATPPTAMPRSVSSTTSTSNLLPSQNNPPMDVNAPTGDARSPVGWVFSKVGAYRIRDGDNDWGGLRTPDGAPLYNVLQGDNSYMRVTLTNLQRMGMYRMTGYACSCPKFPVGAKFNFYIDGVPEPLAQYTMRGHVFTPIGPMDFMANKTSHMFEFRGQSSGDKAVLIGGLSIISIARQKGL